MPTLVFPGYILIVILILIVRKRRKILYCLSLAPSSSSRLEHDSLTVETYQESRWVINTARNVSQKFIRVVFSPGIGYDHGQSNCIGGTGRVPCGNWDLAQAALHSGI